MKTLNFVSHFRKWNNQLVHYIGFFLNNVVPKLISNVELHIRIKKENKKWIKSHYTEFAVLDHQIITIFFF